MCLSKTDLEYFKKKLISLKNEIVISEIEEVDSSGDDVDKINALYLISLQNDLSYREKEKVKKISRALDKIDSNTFGICEECEEPIAKKRLEFDPCFRLCVLCQEELSK